MALLSRREAAPLAGLAPLIAAKTLLTSCVPGKESKDGNLPAIRDRGQLVQLGLVDVETLTAQTVKAGEIKFPLPAVFRPDRPFSVENASYDLTVSGQRKKYPVLAFHIPQGDRYALFTSPFDGSVEIITDGNDNVFTFFRAKISGRYTAIFDIFSPVAVALYQVDTPSIPVRVGDPLFMATWSPLYKDQGKKTPREVIGDKGSLVEVHSYPKGAAVALRIEGSTLHPTLNNILRTPDGKYGWYLDMKSQNAQSLMEDFFLPNSPYG